MKMRLLKIGLLALLLACLIASPAGAKSPLNEEQAFDTLARQIQKGKLYDSWTSMSCLSFIIEETTKSYFDFAIREKHDAKCQGDPNTASIVDRFRVNRITGKIQWFDPVEGEYKPYKAVLKSRLKR
jgi:hypothetical protein